MTQNLYSYKIEYFNTWTIHDHPDLILLSWFNAGCRMLYRTHRMAGATTNNRSNPLLSSEEATLATVMISSADAPWVDMNPAAAKPPPSPRPTTTAFSVLILLSWLSAGWRML
ncbi:unnamed protein product [Musa hybrid cultivar]